MDTTKTLRNLWLFWSALPALSVLGLSACDKGMEQMDMAPPPEAKFSNLTPIFSRSCSFSSCHQNANMAYGNLKLSDSTAYCNLVGQAGGATFRDTAKGAFPRRVTPGDRQASFLYKKLTLSDAESDRTKPLGQRMPPGGVTLEADELDLFGRWIDAGAKNDTPGAGQCP